MKEESRKRYWLNYKDRMPMRRRKKKKKKKKKKKRFCCAHVQLLCGILKNKYIFL